MNEKPQARKNPEQSAAQTASDDRRSDHLRTFNGELPQEIRDLLPKPTETKPSDTERRRQEARRELGAAIRDLQAGIQAAEHRLSTLKRKPIERIMGKGTESQTLSIDPREIATAEDAVLGLRMKKDVLQDADAALATGSPLPADLALALDAMEQEEAQALDTAWTAGVDTSVPKERLRRLSELRRKLGFRK